MGVGAGMDHYRESGMRLTGPAVNLRYELITEPQSPWLLEVGATLARMKYSSQETGNLSGVVDVGTDWRAFHALGSVWGRPIHAGLSVRTHWNDLRGTTSTGHEGYIRKNVGVWGNLRWRQRLDTNEGDAVTVSYTLGILLAGWHKSYLSQANSNYGNVLNRQHRGLTLGAQGRWRLEGRDVEPYVQYTWVGNSDVIQSGDVWVTEPSNRRLLLGVVFWNSR